MALKCTTASCDRKAERVVAVEMVTESAVFVAPYCQEHGDALIEKGHFFAVGPALSDECSGIEGVRRG